MSFSSTSRSSFSTRSGNSSLRFKLPTRSLPHWNLSRFGSTAAAAFAARAAGLFLRGDLEIIVLHPVAIADQFAPPRIIAIAHR